MFMDKRKKHEELDKEHSQRDEQIQMLMRLKKTDVPSFEGRVDESI